MSGINLAPDCKSIWDIVQAIRELAQGRSNAVGQVTLRASQTTTVVTKATDKAAVNVSADCEIFLTPRSAGSAAELGTTFISAVGQGTFTITHASGVTTRTFGWVALG